MRQMTVRDIPEEVEAIVRSEADLRGVSLNKAFIAVLKRGAAATPVAPLPEERVKGRFARFSGIWSEEEAAAFDDTIDTQRTIESELWR